MRSQKTGNKTLKLSIVFDKLHCSPDSWLKKKFFVSDIYMACTWSLKKSQEIQLLSRKCPYISVFRCCRFRIKNSKCINDMIWNGKKKIVTTTDTKCEATFGHRGSLLCTKTYQVECLASYCFVVSMKLFFMLQKKNI